MKNTKKLIVIVVAIITIQLVSFLMFSFIQNEIREQNVNYLKHRYERESTYLVARLNNIDTSLAHINEELF